MLIENLNAAWLALPDETGNAAQQNPVTGPGRTIVSSYDVDPYNEVTPKPEGPKGWPWNFALPSWWPVWGQGASATAAHGREHDNQSRRELLARPGYLPGMQCSQVVYDIWSPQVYLRGLPQPVPNNNRISLNG